MSVGIRRADGTTLVNYLNRNIRVSAVAAAVVAAAVAAAAAAADAAAAAADKMIIADRI